MASRPEELRDRTKKFAINIVRLIRTLPRTEESRVIGRQLLRCGTSVAANYRAVCRARSRAEFISKIGIVVEESDETVFWLELMEELDIMSKDSLIDLKREANELVSIFAASQRTLRQSATRS
ncbi:MAG TPA: four helix bundle protein [Bacteroidota bacterium]|nr:four helix bundle protein [Bacteroidota bacterium]